jgi:enoyl-CoA hydratase/carnithine racemase
VELRSGVLWLTFDRPERLNSFTTSDYRDLQVALRDASGARAGCIVLTGVGRAFSAGADRSLVDGTATPAELEAAGQAFGDLLETLGSCSTPVLAAVNGLAVGFGCTLLLHCDLVVLAASARLRTPFTALGIAPEAASSVLLPGRVRRPDAVWMLLSSEWVDAPLAASMGLAWKVVPDDDLAQETQLAAETLATLDLDAVAATKRLLAHGQADLVRAAIERETAAMRSLRGDASAGPGPQNPGD